MTIEETLQVMQSSLEDKKGIQIELINLEGKTILADWFVIATGTSVTHNRTLADAVETSIKEKTGQLPDHIEGYSSGRWILLDYGDIIVHILHMEERQFYSLEKLWQGQRR